MIFNLFYSWYDLYGGEPMDIRVLRYFLTVAQEENMTKAAELLHTSQSNLSRQLADLESSLGKKLFDRGGRKIILTEEGMFLRKRAQEIIELTDRTENDMKSFNQSINGTVHIVVTARKIILFLLFLVSVDIFRINSSSRIIRVKIPEYF